QRRRVPARVGGAQDGLLEKGTVRRERQQLLGIERSRQRPQARSRPSTQDNRIDPSLPHIRRLAYHGPSRTARPRIVRSPRLLPRPPLPDMACRPMRGGLFLVALV